MYFFPFAQFPERGGMSGLGVTYLMVVADGDSIPVSLFNG